MSSPVDFSRFRRAARTKPSGEQAHSGDRRADRRYPINAALKYRITYRRKVIGTGPGRTIDMSSTGMLFESTSALPRGLKIEIWINWPALPAFNNRLELHAEGRTVRAQDNCTAVHIQKYTFRGQPSPESTKHGR